MSVIDGAKVRWREWREHVAEKKAAARAVRSHDPHGHSRFWLLNIPAAATICAAIVEWYWAMLFCIEATGHIDWNWETGLGSGQPTTSDWNFAFSAHLPVLIGLMCATAPIVMISMVWLPVQFVMRGSGRWRRGTVVAVGLLANILVIVSGTVVMNYNRQTQVRDALVVEQSADANRAMLQANVEGLQHELDTLMNHRSTYVATAASVGADAYERGYVAQARATSDPRLPLLERALGAARRADDLRGQILAARQAAATAAPAAATAATVQDDVGATLNSFAEHVTVWRPPAVAAITTLIGILGAWWVIALLEHLNPKDVLRSGWADAEHRIEDMRGAEVVDSEGRRKEVEPMDPPRTVVTDAETGEEMTRVKPHWRKLKKGKKVQVEVQVEDRGPKQDETGVAADGGGRIALTPAGPLDVSEFAEGASDADVGAEPAKPHSENESQPEPVHPEPPVSDLHDEEALELAAVLPEEASDSEGAADAQGEEANASPNVEQEHADDGGADGQNDQGENEAEGSGEEDVHPEPPSTREPETDPKRLIAAE